MIFRITGVRITWVQLYNKLAEKLNKIVFLLYLLICDENLVERERESFQVYTPHRHCMFMKLFGQWLILKSWCITWLVNKEVAYNG